MSSEKPIASIRILIVDEHKLLRDDLSALFEQLEDIVIVGSVSSAEQAINVFTSIKPDIILMDISMEGISGIEATRSIKEQYPGTKVILTSAVISKELVTAAIQSVIDGCVPKDIDITVLVEAIKSVRNGERFFDEAITKLLFEEFYQNKKTTVKKVQSGTVNDLTTREKEVLALVASGKTNRHVAHELFISIKTVDTHKANIRLKLGLKHTAELVRYAIKNKLIGLD